LGLPPYLREQMTINVAPYPFSFSKKNSELSNQPKKITAVFWDRKGVLLVVLQKGKTINAAR